MSRKVFDEICSKLNDVDCTFKRYVKPDMIEAGWAKDYSDFSGRVENQFEYIHELTAAIECSNRPQQKELWHILSNGQIKA
jgi:hypothetical protein